VDDDASGGIDGLDPPHPALVEFHQFLVVVFVGIITARDALPSGVSIGSGNRILLLALDAAISSAFLLVVRLSSILRVRFWVLEHSAIIASWSSPIAAAPSKTWTAQDQTHRPSGSLLLVPSAS
jgi:hypothetical protein